MKFSRLLSRSFAASALLILVALPPVACAAVAVAGPATSQTAVAGSNSKTNGVSGTNAAPAELPVPLAEFELTIKPTKDPFFPNSTRQPVPVINPTNTVPLYSPQSFTLKGLSGARNERLALINNRTFAIGETNEVTTPSGKITIRCVDIKEFSVLIIAPGQSEPLEISLRKILQ